MINLSKLKAIVEPYKNTLVISDDFKIVRLVDVIEETDDVDWPNDFY